MFKSKKEEDEKTAEPKAAQRSAEPEANDAQKDAQQKAQKAQQDAEKEQRKQQPVSARDVNLETVDDAALVNPHNEAFAQRPSPAPDVRPDLRAWAKRVRLGGPRDADWEDFDKFVKSKDDEETKALGEEPDTHAAKGEKP